MGVVAGLAAGACVWLLFRARAGVPDARPPLRGRRPATVVFAAAALAATGLLLLVEGTALVLGLILLAGTVAAGHLVALARRRKAAVVQEERVVEICETLAAELRSGQPPARALAHCASVWPELGPAAGAAHLGAEVSSSLRLLGARPGAGALRAVAGAWQVSMSSGASLTHALGQVAATAREAQAVRRVVTSELASAQATARLVAGLPVVALTLSGGPGGDAWRFLLTEPLGLSCLAVGMALTFLGLWWIERLAAGVSR